MSLVINSSRTTGFEVTAVVQRSALGRLWAVTPGTRPARAPRCSCPKPLIFISNPRAAARPHKYNKAEKTEHSFYRSLVTSGRDARGTPCVLPVHRVVFDRHEARLVLTEPGHRSTGHGCWGRGGAG